MIQACGVMVVRKPEFASDESVKYNFRLESKIYRGLDRLPWEDLDSQYYNKSLPVHLSEMRNILDKKNNDLTGVRVTSNLDIARSVFNLNPTACDVIGVWSEELSSIKGEYLIDGEFHYMGLDCISLGEWSAILVGIFSNPDKFSEFVPLLNDDGLLSKISDCAALFRRYKQLSKLGLTEPMAPNAKCSAVKVYRLGL